MYPWYLRSYQFSVLYIEDVREQIPAADPASRRPKPVPISLMSEVREADEKSGPFPTWFAWVAVSSAGRISSK